MTVLPTVDERDRALGVLNPDDRFAADFTRPYVEGVRAGCAELPKLLHAVWANDSFSFLNPASRSTGKGSTLA